MAITFLSVRTKRLHFFAETGDMRAPKYVELATSVSSTCGIHITFEEVMPDVADVVLDKSSAFLGAARRESTR